MPPASLWPLQSRWRSPPSRSARQTSSLSRATANPTSSSGPLVESIGLDPDSQMKRLRRKSSPTTVMMTVVGEDGRNREMTAINIKSLTMWLATIDEDRVNETSRPGRDRLHPLPWHRCPVRGGRWRTLRRLPTPGRDARSGLPKPVSKVGWEVMGRDGQDDHTFWGRPAGDDRHQPQDSHYVAGDH